MIWVYDTRTGKSVQKRGSAVICEYRSRLLVARFCENKHEPIWQTMINCEPLFIKETNLRIRKISCTNEYHSLDVNATGEDGTIASTLALIGGNRSGKSTLMEFATVAFRSLGGVRSDDEIEWNRQVLHPSTNGFCEFESGRGIYSVSVKGGKIVRHDSVHTVRSGAGTVEDCFLAYDTSMCREFLDRKNRNINEIYARLVLKDLYIGRVRNSIIWIDDIDLGLDAMNGREFVRLVLRKVAEGDNQVFMSSLSKECFGGLRREDQRILTSEGSSSLIKSTHEDVLKLRQV